MKCFLFALLALLALAAFATDSQACDGGGLFGVRGRVQARHQARAGTVTVQSTTTTVRTSSACVNGVCPAPAKIVPAAKLPGFDPVPPKK
jgi:hypothetical protein